jgi:hypothetical protein
MPPTVVVGFWLGRSLSASSAALLLSPLSGAHSNHVKWNFSPQNHTVDYSPERPTSSPYSGRISGTPREALTVTDQTHESAILVHSSSAIFPAIAATGASSPSTISTAHRRSWPPPVSSFPLFFSAPQIRILWPGLEGSTESVSASQELPRCQHSQARLD